MLMCFSVMMVQYCAYEETVLILRKCLKYLLRDKFHGACNFCLNGSAREKNVYE